MDVLDLLTLIKPLRQPCVCDDASSSSSSSSLSRASAAPSVAHEKYIPASAAVPKFGHMASRRPRSPARLDIAARRRQTTPDDDDDDDDARRWVDRA
jgi:hypothetical protein